MSRRIWLEVEVSCRLSRSTSSNSHSTPRLERCDGVNSIRTVISLRPLARRQRVSIAARSGSLWGWPGEVRGPRGNAELAEHFRGVQVRSERGAEQSDTVRRAGKRARRPPPEPGNSEPGNTEPGNSEPGNSEPGNN